MNNEFELIKEELLIKDMHKVVIIDQMLLKQIDKELILDKISKLEVDYIYNNIDYSFMVCVPHNNNIRQKSTNNTKNRIEIRINKKESKKIKKLKGTLQKYSF